MKRASPKLIFPVVFIVTLLAGLIAVGGYFNRKTLVFEHPSDEILSDVFESERSKFAEMGQLIEALASKACEPSDIAQCQESKEKLETLADDVGKLYSRHSSDYGVGPVFTLISFSRQSIRWDSLVSHKGFAYFTEPMSLCSNCSKMTELNRLDSPEGRRSGTLYNFRSLNDGWYLYWTARLGQM